MNSEKKTPGPAGTAPGGERKRRAMSFSTTILGRKLAAVKDILRNLAMVVGYHV